MRKLHVTETMVQKYGPTLGCERCHWTCAVNKSHDAACRLGMTALLCLPFKAQEKSQTHDTPVAMDTRAELASLSTVAADMEIQLPVTEKRAAGTTDDSAVEDGHKDTKQARTMRGMEVWWTAFATNCSANLVGRPRIGRTAKKKMLSAEACLNTSVACHVGHLRRKDSSSKKQVDATRFG